MEGSSRTSSRVNHGAPHDRAGLYGRYSCPAGPDGQMDGVRPIPADILCDLSVLANTYGKPERNQGHGTERYVLEAGGHQEDHGDAVAAVYHVVRGHGDGVQHVGKQCAEPDN